MAAFNFKFKSVQNVKKNLEKKAQRELAFIENQIESLKSSKGDLLTDLKEHRLTAMQTVKLAEIKKPESHHGTGKTLSVPAFILINLIG